MNFIVQSDYSIVPCRQLGPKCVSLNVKSVDAMNPTDTTHEGIKYITLMAPLMQFEPGATEAAPAPILFLLQVFNFAIRFICSITSSNRNSEEKSMLSSTRFEPISEAVLNAMTVEEKSQSLRAAAEAGNLVAVQQLLRADTYASSPDKEGYTPLHWAAARGHLLVTRELLDAGALLEERGGRKFLFTPLHMAAGEGHLEICRLLLDRGARVNASDRYRDTPLHWAAWFGHLPVAQLLVERGSHVASKNRDDHTPEDMASLMNRVEMVEWLKQKHKEQSS